MLRLAIFFQIILFNSCVSSKSINHFASKNKLTVKEVENISLFNGKIEIEDNSKTNNKELVYLLYNNNKLNYISNKNRIINNEFIYKLIQEGESDITFTRATLFPRYYTVDTLLFSKDFALKKRCLYDNNNITQSYFWEYRFSHDTLNIRSYQFQKDIITISLYKSNLNTITEKLGEPHYIQLYPNQERRTFFQRFME